MRKLREVNPLGYMCAAIVMVFLIAVCVTGWVAELRIHSAGGLASCSASTVDGRYSIVVEEQPHRYYDAAFGGERYRVTVVSRAGADVEKSVSSDVSLESDLEGCIVEVNDEYGEIFLGDPEEIPREREYGLTEPLFRIYWDDVEWS